MNTWASNSSGRPVSIHFQNAGGAHYRRFLLSRSKTFRTFSINIYAREFFTVVIVHRHLPVAVLSPAVAVETGLSLGRSLGGRLLLLFLFQFSRLSEARGTLDFSSTLITTMTTPMRPRK